MSGPLKRYFIYAVLMLSSGMVQAQDNIYLDVIKPVLRARCYACHGTLKQEADLRLDTAASLKRSTNNGKLLIERVSAEDVELRMPPEGEPLTPMEINAIRQWVENGAPEPPNELPEQSPEQHWAFNTPVRPHLNGNQNPIDELISKSYSNLGIGHERTPANDGALIRRLYLDLTGIPPNYQELSEFLEGDVKYSDVVDKLLTSPLYGQRWGRHWMDIWRYSDWYGRRNVNDVRNSDPQIWRWRDWIVDSLNQDKSYAVMIQQMLAADELYPHDDQAWPATGYLIRSYYSLNPNEWMRHNAEYTGKSFLGLTFNCAHCHDHKYDPIAHDDYFRLRAFFEPLGIRSDQVQGEQRPPEFLDYTYGGSRTPVKIGMVRVFDQDANRPTYFYTGGDERNVDKERGSIAPGVPDFLNHLLPQITPINQPPTAWYPGLRDVVRRHELDTALANHTTAKTQWETAANQPRTDRTPLQTKVNEAKANYDRLVETLKQNGETSALQGRNSLYLNAGTGRRIFHHELENLKSVKDGTVIQFELQILEDSHINFQLARDTRQRRTATYIAFDNGAIRSYLPGGYTALEVGKYQLENNESRFHVVFTLHPEQDTMDIDVTVKTPHGQLIRQIPTASAALNGWDCTKQDFQPITLDCRTNTIAIYDAIRVSTPGEDEIVLDFESEEFQPGKDAANINGWQLAMGSANSQSSILNVLPTPELQQAMDDLEQAETILQQADLPLQIAETKLAAATAQLESLQAVLDADNLRYQNNNDLSSGKISAQIQATIQKQHRASILSATLTLQTAQLELNLAHQLATDDPERVKKIESATTAVTTAEKTLADLKTKDLSKVDDYDHLSSFTPKTSSGRRAALARMITDRRNPLTARVAVNHIWTRHFQTPLVETPADFGRNGQPPIFPEVLDYLAVHLMESNWSLKSVHRSIVMSKAYQQSSVPNKDHASQASQLLVTFPHKRMEAEMVRDSILAIAGTLDVTPATNPLENTQALKTHKRSMYYETFPEAGGNSALGKVFDAPSPTECYRRTSTIVPQQALVLTNSEFIHNAVGQLHQRIQSSHQPETAEQFVEVAFLSILNRKPNNTEANLAVDFLASDGEKAVLEKALLRVLFNHNDFVTIR
ncbi:MAG: hypothetical protein CMJ82_03390 [Planctomycetaceae bacterium]|nr:hypothetical protein [Planctomycetaceae bacterium]